MSNGLLANIFANFDFKDFFKKKLKNNKVAAKMDIDHAYLAFSFAIIVVILLWILFSSILMYEMEEDNLKRRLPIQAKIVESRLTNDINVVDNYSSFIGDKILLFGFEKKEDIASLLKRSFNMDLLLRNVYSWIYVDYVNPENQLEITSSEGILDQTREVPDFYPIDKDPASIWRFNIGRVMDDSDSFSIFRSIPVSLTIDDDDLKYRGALVSKILVDRIQRNIDSALEGEKVQYVVLDSNFDVVAKSKKLEDEFGAADTDLGKIDDSGIVEIEDAKLRGALILNKQIRVLVADSAVKVDSKFGFLNKDVEIDNVVYRYYRQSEYPFVVLIGYNRDIIVDDFVVWAIRIAWGSFCISALFLIILYIFRHFQIIPFVKEIILARETAEAASVAKGQFLSNMSHELRTPMNGIVGMCDMLRQTKLNGEQNKYTETIYRSSEALLSILNDILDFSKIEAQKVTLEEIGFDLYDLLEDIATLLSASANKKAVEVIADVDLKVPRYVVGDPVRLRQIIVNLVNNSIKFTQEGQVVIEVKALGDVKNDDGKEIWTLRFDIIDSGIGIDKSKIKDMFSKFTQADMSTTRKFGGTGLGLSIAKELTRLMKGRIHVESTIGKGSDFWLSIPLPKSTEMKFDVKRHAQIIKVTKGKRVLVVEANEINRKVIEKKLVNLGITVRFMGRDSKQDIEKYRFYDAIILGFDITKHFNVVKILDKISENSRMAKVSLALFATAYDQIKFDKELIKKFKVIFDKPLKTEMFYENIVELFDIKIIDSKADLAVPKEGEEVVIREGIRVLLCEDNNVNIQVAKSILRKFKCIVDVAEDGAIGIDKFQNNEYDLVLMDCMMPNMDGYQATAKIRKLEKEGGLSRIKIIALTANAMSEDHKRCLDSGMDDVATKPIKIVTLKDILKDMG